MKITYKDYIRLLGHYLRPQWPRAVLLAILIFGMIGLQLLNPQILSAFIDDALAGKSVWELSLIALIFIGVALVTQVVSVWSVYVSENVGWTATNLMRVDLTEHTMSLDMSFHNGTNPGAMIERIDGDVTAMANFFSQFVIKVVGNLLLLAGILVLLWVEDWRVGLALSLYSLIAFGVLSRVRNLGVEATKEERQASAEKFGFLEERLAGLEDIRSNGASSFVMQGLARKLRNYYYKAHRAWMKFSVVWVITISLFAVGYFLVFLISAFLFIGGEITLGKVYLFYQYTELLRTPIEQLNRQVQDLQKAGAGVARVTELFNKRSQVTDGPGQAYPAGPLPVAFEKVEFTYNTEQAQPTLDDISFRLKPGEVMGLLGRTGSGKTTITRLLFRLYEPQAGRITLGGEDIRQAKLTQLRGKIGMVTQEVQLFHASVRDNLTFFNRSISDEHILAVIEDIGLSDWFNSLPDGLDTQLKVGQAGLSAGEAQLLAFTRVFLENPGLVILDEASSRLDPATEHLTQRAVEKLLHNRTGIIIAHRLATVQKVDRIMILDEGRIAEEGRREELAADPSSHFYGLLKTGLEEALV
ncbi:MAG: ABC transporter ATP-binding protein [Chloroflexi bacterium]|nr:ABC transporter ATP-binding protein [Chloroflexota bacterium]OJV92530.1 MAG: helicase [Chloroflexi bacterium 54-19]